MPFQSSAFSAITPHPYQKPYSPNANFKSINTFFSLCLFVVKQAARLEEIVDEGQIMVANFLFIVENDRV